MLHYRCRVQTNLIIIWPHTPCIYHYLLKEAHYTLYCGLFIFVLFGKKRRKSRTPHRRRVRFPQVDSDITRQKRRKGMKGAPHARVSHCRLVLFGLAAHLVSQSNKVTLSTYSSHPSFGSASPERGTLTCVLCGKKLTCPVGTDALLLSAYIITPTDFCPYMAVHLIAARYSPNLQISPTWSNTHFPVNSPYHNIYIKN